MQRRLVKSPPELWAEVSDAEALARRLRAFGDIRITRIEAETTVAWEGDSVRGTVELEGSGWGTRVTLTAMRDPAVLDPPSPPAEAVPAPAPPPESQAEPPAPVSTPSPSPQEGGSVQAHDPDARVPAPPPAPRAEAEPHEADERAPGELASCELDEGLASAPPEEAAPPRRGLFARLFRRARHRAEVPAPPSPMPTPGPDPVPPTPTPDPVPDPVPAPDPGPPEPSPDPTPPEPLPDPEPARAPEPDPPLPEPAPEPDPPVGPDPLPAAAVETGPSAAETLALLESVLDDLGAAHHRPFSRG